VTTTVYFVLRRIDREASRRITALRDIPHGHIGFLDMVAQSICIKQRVRLAITVELLPYRGDHHGIGCKLQGQSLVFVETPSDEFGKADRAEQARSHAADETLPHAREHRQSDPKRIARRGMRIDGEIVEEEVGQAVFGANTRRHGSTPRERTSLQRLRVAASLVCNNHNTLPSTCRSSRIHMSKNRGG
jgi:hypothetical protein